MPALGSIHGLSRCDTETSNTHRSDVCMQWQFWYNHFSFSQHPAHFLICRNSIKNTNRLSEVETGVVEPQTFVQGTYLFELLFLQAEVVHLEILLQACLVIRLGDNSNAPCFVSNSGNVVPVLTAKLTFV